ncbi:hypothetical protein GCM10009801_81820 [Streptomyces albiaxialis]|uniref:TraD/TraG TraM recognition site domain-containing protein n=1 Tax=Streptomyces albiaxialis TaxID=329523 RepID=A0ABP5IS65_9ACTN
MSEQTSPTAGAGAAAPATILGIIIGAAVLGTASWLGGTLGAALGGGGWAPPPYSIATGVDFLKGGPSALWPEAPTGGLVGMLVLLVLVAVSLVVAGVLLWRRFRPGSGLGGRREMRALGKKAAEERARQLRPELAKVKELETRDLGVRLGELAPNGVDGPFGPELYGSDEDTYTVVMGPRAGKTSGLAVPILLDAPGAALLTSNRNDAYAITRRERARHGTTHTFDLQQITYAERDVWVDLLSSARSIEGASRLAMHFINADSDTRAADDFWAKAGSNTLMALFHAAAVSGATFDDVLRWLDTPADRAPVNALKSSNPALASRLSSTVAGAVETRDGIYETARQATNCLLDPEIRAWVTPDKSRPKFDPYAFVTSKDTAYLLSKDGGGSAAAITASIADLIFRGGTLAAERNGTGRLPIPLRAVLDEAANVCRIADLPKLYSHLGGRGINPVTILQSYKQGSMVWSEGGMDALWVASTVKLLGAGQDDADFAENISKLAGKHDVRDISTSHGSSGRSTSLGQREKEILQASKVRQLERGHGLVWASGTPMARFRLTPWMFSEQAETLKADKAAEEKAITARANEAEVIL